MVAKVIRLLQGLRTELVASRQSIINSYQAEKKDNEELAESFNSKIENLDEKIIPALREDIETRSGSTISLTIST